jgi:CDP-glycerol glycerophosphotransferase (TagB/SpsB family)
MPSSTVGFEASLHDIPLIVTNMNNQKYHDLAFGYQKEKAALYATNLQELFNSILQIIDDSKVRKRLQKFQNKLNLNLNHINDGKATERVFHKIIDKESKNSFIQRMRKSFTGDNDEKN